MGRYYNLKAATGYVSHYDTLDATLQVRAEAEADRVITRELRDFDRQTWRGATVTTPIVESTNPLEVDRAGELLASGHYIILQATKDNPTQGIPDDSLPHALIKEAMDILRDVQDTGRLTMPDDAEVEAEAPADRDTVGGGAWHVPMER